MDGLLSSLKKLNDVLSRLLLAAGAIIIAVIVLSLFAEAVARYVFGSSQAFMEEMPRLLVPFVVFPLMGALLRAGRHIAVEVIPGRLAGLKRHVLMIAVHAVTTAVGGQFTLSGMLAVLHFKAMGLVSVSEWAVPMWCVYLAFPVGFGLLTLSGLELLLRECRELRGSLKPGQGPVR
jgi:TRAP-type C4-dicarboxylate transport system permease small subunit